MRRYLQETLSWAAVVAFDLEAAPVASELAAYVGVADFDRPAAYGASAAAAAAVVALAQGYA